MIVNFDSQYISINTIFYPFFILLSGQNIIFFRNSASDIIIALQILVRQGFKEVFLFDSIRTCQVSYCPARFQDLEKRPGRNGGALYGLRKYGLGVGRKPAVFFDLLGGHPGIVAGGARPEASVLYFSRSHDPHFYLGR